jgi:extradiol dioxygenase family protein
LNQATRALEPTLVEAGTPPPQSARPAAPQGLALFDVGIVAKNVAELRAFYEKVGFPLRFGNERLVVFGLGAHDLAIHVADQVPRGAVGFSVLVDDVGPIADRLTAAGIAFDRHDEPFHANLAGLQLEDPNGNVIQILARR